MNEIHSRSPSTGFRDQALARLTSGPPDEGYCEERRQAWRAWVARLAGGPRVLAAGKGSEGRTWTVFESDRIRTQPKEEPR